ncbi:MAG: hypothetical protein IH948_07785 [Bacteroidetes bacterium]|nr:hypothetical protein [Bacteroidota bacterium]
MEKVNHTSNVSKMNKLVFGALKLGESLLNLERRLQKQITDKSIYKVLKEKEGVIR